MKPPPHTKILETTFSEDARALQKRVFKINSCLNQSQSLNLIKSFRTDSIVTDELSTEKIY